MLAKANELYGSSGNVPVAKDGLDLLKKITAFTLVDFLKIDGWSVGGTISGSVMGNNTYAAGTATVELSTRFVFKNSASTIALWLLPKMPFISRLSFGNAQDWRKIAPLKSTRTEVEALLGAAQGAYSPIYRLREGSLFVEYSSGPCRPERKLGWNVRENVVVSLSFSPRHKKRVGDLKIGPKKFSKTVDQHVIGIIYYVNEEDGITYEIQNGRWSSLPIPTDSLTLTEPAV